MTDPALIERIEQLAGCALPEDYRTWLAGNRRSIEFPAKIVIPDDPPWIDHVAPLYEPAKIIQLMEDERRLNEVGERDIPNGSLYIGDNDNGDPYLISLAPDSFGHIWYANHEYMEWHEEDLSGMFVLATSFTEWLDIIEKGLPENFRS